MKNGADGVENAEGWYPSRIDAKNFSFAKMRRTKGNVSTVREACAFPLQNKSVQLVSMIHAM